MTDLCKIMKRCESTTCLGITAPVLQAIVGVPLKHLIPFLAGNVPISLFFDLRKDPRFDESSSANHHTCARWTSCLKQNRLSSQNKCTGSGNISTQGLFWSFKFMNKHVILQFIVETLVFQL